MSDCICYETDPKTWTTYGSSVEPGSQWEPNPDCHEHFPAEDEPLIKVSPDLLRLGEGFNRQMNDAMIQVNAACAPIYDSLVEAMRRTGQLLREARR